MSAHTILALDPGKTTGICLATLTDKLYVAPHQDMLTLGATYNLLRWFCDARSNNTHIIYEDFEYRNNARMGLNLVPVKVIGIIELFKEWHEPFVTFTKQSAATGKAFYNDDRLKELGVYAVGKQHGRDATRHLLQWANFGAGGQYMNINEIQMEMIPIDPLWETLIK